MEPRLYVRPGRCLYTGQLVDRALSIAEPSRNPIPFLDPWQREAELCTSCHLPSNHYKQNKAGGFPWKINVLDSDSLLPLLEQNKLQLYWLLLVFVTGANNLMDFILTVLTVYVLA